jgi:hypothetical protein
MNNSTTTKTGTSTITDNESEYLKVLGLLDAAYKRHQEMLAVLKSLGKKRLTSYGLKFSLNTGKFALILTGKNGEKHSYIKWGDVPDATVYDLLWDLQPLPLKPTNVAITQAIEILARKLKTCYGGCMLQGCLIYYARGLHTVIISQTTQAQPTATIGRDRIAALRQLAHLLY